MNKETITIAELLKYGYETLKKSKIDTYSLDTELLLGKVLNKDRLFILLNRSYKVDYNTAKEYFKLINIRKEKMPVKYILGRCEFMGLDFYIREGVLIPRPDTETLVEYAIKEIKENNFKNICDVCCGSGIIGISIGKFINDVHVICTDISDIAYEVATKNIELFNLEHKAAVEKGDLLENFIEQNDKLDLIVSNPPYIKTDVIPSLMKDVREYEPYNALCGGNDGLDFYRKITAQSTKILNDSGMLIYEIGYDQRLDVQDILIKNGFKNVKCIKDLAGKDRVISAQYIGAN
ncbi:peptide chain release factor N(5)-glutamine methyltransferase [Clostridium sp. JN-1]|jgi:release factor glutamine methyltransferase|uniref:peptide chain release factor N(5)-glutamine methyltransferase n=1 Tax=Clostridium sp. JN-1 TaxID=2483110 RepID=UPI000F0BB874|nr:peptide chain release factor N(5)-glutamine methyltransferase [Clostridium sp. JN-1]